MLRPWNGGRFLSLLVLSLPKENGGHRFLIAKRIRGVITSSRIFLLNR